MVLPMQGSEHLPAYGPTNQLDIFDILRCSNDNSMVMTCLRFPMQGPEHLPAYKPGGRLETFDIEELVAEGKAGYDCLPCALTADPLLLHRASIVLTLHMILPLTFACFCCCS